MRRIDPNRFAWPSKEDVCWFNRTGIIARIPPLRCSDARTAIYKSSRLSGRISSQEMKAHAEEELLILIAAELHCNYRKGWTSKRYGFVYTNNVHKT